MQHFRNSILFFLLLTAILSRAQQPEIIQKYILEYKSLAISEMQRTGVPAAITLAQGIHESGAGLSPLALASNNHFGIKCKSNWTGESVRHDDDAKGECFRKYPSAVDSYKDHSDFLKNSQRYGSLFSLDPIDYSGWAKGLKKAGYATNPKYPEVLIKMIEDYNLQDYSLIALGKIPGEDGIVKESLNKLPDLTVTTAVIAESPKQQYPDGPFLLNETKTIYAKKGTSFLAIARQYDIDLSKIFEFNEIARSEFCEQDQLIFLQRKRKTGNHDIHIVQPGESLHDIAQQEAIRLESLRELNWLKEAERPAIGEKLSLKSKSASMPKLAIKENFSLTPAVKDPGSN